MEIITKINQLFLTFFGGGIFWVLIKISRSVIGFYVAKTKRVNDTDGDIIEMKALLEDLVTDNIEIKKTLKVHKRSNVSILHDKVYKHCREYIKLGEVSVEELDNLEYLFNSYKEQGGNGTGDNLYNRVKELKIKD